MVSIGGQGEVALQRHWTTATGLWWSDATRPELARIRDDDDDDVSTLSLIVGLFESL